MKNYNFKMDNNTLLTALPSKNGRYVVVDTETTGFSPNHNNIIEIAVIEINKGKLTGLQFHGHLRPRFRIDPKAREKHKFHDSFYDDFYDDVYQTDKNTLENFLKFIGNSIVFAHNATFDLTFINNELKHWKLPQIPKGRFRCTMRIFRNIFGSIDHNLKKFCSLAKCCELFKLRNKEEKFHNALFDSYMTARMLCKMYEFQDNKDNGNSIINLNLNHQSNNYGINNIILPRDINNIPDNYENYDNYDNDNYEQQDTNSNNNIFKENTHPNLNLNIDDEISNIENDILLIQDNEGFIKNYMNEQNNNNHNNNNMNIDTYVFEEQVTVEKIVTQNNINDDEFMNPNINNIATPAKNLPKYKELMRKFVNSYKKTNDIQSSMNKIKEERKEELMQLNIDDIEDIMKDAI